MLYYPYRTQVEPVNLLKYKLNFELKKLKGTPSIIYFISIFSPNYSNTFSSFKRIHLFKQRQKHV